MKNFKPDTEPVSLLSPLVPDPELSLIMRLEADNVL